MGMIKKSSPLVRWLLVANFVLVVCLALTYLPRIGEDRHAEGKQIVQRMGMGSKDDADVLFGENKDLIIDLFDRIVREMPPRRNDQWRGRLTVVAVRLGIDKDLSAPQRSRINEIAKRMIQEGRAKENPDAQSDGALWVGRYGSVTDIRVLEPLLVSQDPVIRASAEKAVKRLADAKKA